jgi:hypothetical protein
MTAALRAAYRAGFAARLAEIPRDENPYADDSLSLMTRAARNMWALGWDEADKEIERIEGGQ